MTADVIAWLFDAGHAADVMLGVLAFEALVLRTRCWNWTSIFGLLGPAVFLVLGLRASLVGAEWYWITGLLALSFPLHVFDLKQRSKNAQTNSG